MALSRSIAVPVEDASQVAGARRHAATIAERLAFDPARVGQVALVATELATNLARHARRGELLVRTADDGTGAAAETVEILSIDRGPGITDVTQSRRDGFSTAGTAGAGLGAVERQSDLFEIYSQPSGTVALSRISREPPRRPVRPPPLEIGAVLVAKAGEAVAGDAWAWRLREDRLALLLADGLGHGLHAHEAALAATESFARAHEQPPARVVEGIHAALRPTRGAAVALLAADLERGVVRYCGLGNISGHIVRAAGPRVTMVSHSGTAGHTAARIQEFSYPISADALIVMHSDGLSAGWDLAAYPGIRARHPSIVCGALYRDFSRQRDDVVVVAAGRRPALNSAADADTRLRG